MREPEIKAALLEAFFNEGRIDDDTVVISEMPVASMARRADIVLANGHLVAFEIKSDGDNTDRLAGQIESYKNAFEGVVIVSGPRHLAEVLETTHSDVGIVIVDEADGQTHAQMVRKPHFKLLGYDAALSQLRAGDLWRLVRSSGLRSIPRDRHSLDRIVRSLPITDVRKAALAAVKERYRPQFEAFVQARSSAVSTKSLLPLLRRPAWKRPPNSAVATFSIEPETVSIPCLKVRPRRVA